MKSEDITFIFILSKWFETPETEGYYLRSRYHKEIREFGPAVIDHICCMCHQYPGYERSLGAVCDVTPQVWLFPNELSTTPGDEQTWMYLHAADPEFFTKLIQGLDEVHLRRYGTKIIRSSQRLGQGKQMADNDKGVDAV